MDCDVCMSDMRLPYGINCGHSLCIRCVVNHLQNGVSSDKCPFCRQTIATVSPNYSLRQIQQTMLGENYVIMTDDERQMIKLIQSLTSDNGELRIVPKKQALDDTSNNTSNDATLGLLMLSHLTQLREEDASNSGDNCLLIVIVMVLILIIITVIMYYYS
jgi:hypothetical protein